MRISDGSADVCSSDLGRQVAAKPGPAALYPAERFAGLAKAEILERIERKWRERIVEAQHVDVFRTRGRHFIDALAARLIARAARVRLLRHAQAAGREDELVAAGTHRSEEHTSELQSLMRISYAVFCLKKKIQPNTNTPKDNVRSS